MTQDKPSKLYHSISEVATQTGVKAHVLRYWETEFPELQPAKGSGGQRSYSRVDVELILRIKRLLYEERFTVAGAKKRLADEAVATAAPAEAKLDSVPQNQVESVRRAVQSARHELEEILASLK